MYIVRTNKPDAEWLKMVLMNKYYFGGDFIVNKEQDKVRFEITRKEAKDLFNIVLNCLGNTQFDQYAVWMFINKISRCIADLEKTTYFEEAVNDKAFNEKVDKEIASNKPITYKYCKNIRSFFWG